MAALDKQEPRNTFTLAMDLYSAYTQMLDDPVKRAVTGNFCEPSLNRPLNAFR